LAAVAPIELGANISVVTLGSIGDGDVNTSFGFARVARARIAVIARCLRRALGGSGLTAYRPGAAVVTAIAAVTSLVANTSLVAITAHARTASGLRRAPCDVTGAALAAGGLAVMVRAGD